MALDETECDAAAADDDDCDEDEHSGVSEVAEAVAATLPPELIPAKMPSSAAKARVVFSAAS